MNEARRIANILGAHAGPLQARGIESLYLFGSRLENTHAIDSDIDLFCDLNPLQKVSLFDLIDIEQTLAELLDAKVDLMSRSGLHPLIAKRIENSAVRLL